MNIPTRDLDLTSTLFGDQHFAPIIVGPIADQKRFHPDGARYLRLAFCHASFEELEDGIRTLGSTS
jgi:isopentenyl diphosphate isomerase/L-lactate dehydrogenase-like FMN-dependent dehydrogenase